MLAAAKMTTGGSAARAEGAANDTASARPTDKRREKRIGGSNPRRRGNSATLFFRGYSGWVSPQSGGATPTIEPTMVCGKIIDGRNELTADQHGGAQVS